MIAHQARPVGGALERVVVDNDQSAVGREMHIALDEIATGGDGRPKRTHRVFRMVRIVGYDETVLPQLANAVISGHDVIMLGERGQAKSRIMRSLINSLAPQVPTIAGCEINDHPYAPICRRCLDLIAKNGDKVEIAWIDRDQRYGEKLATPDISIADLIGEVDPIKVAEGRYLADELTIHYGLLPRTNRGIFGINELPDLAERI